MTLPLFKCRCSAISKIMSNSRSNPTLTEKQEVRLRQLRSELEMGVVMTEKKFHELIDLEAKESNKSKVILSDTCIEYLMEWYAWETEGMIATGKESLEDLAVQKGKECELEAVALLCKAEDVEDYRFHKERIYNEYLSGELDIYKGESVYEAYNVTDIKNVWDYPGFLKKVNTGLVNGQTEQLQGYGDITGAQELYVAYTLVNPTEDMITDMMWRVARKMHSGTLESPEFLKEWPKWEHSMDFRKIHPRKRVHKIKIDPFTESERQKVYDRVKVCREWLSNFHEQRQKLGQKALITEIMNEDAKNGLYE